MSKLAPIGVFDSGIGGLTVLAALRNSMPSENIIYLGDTARMPYGTKSKADIITFCREIVEWFIREYNTKYIISACNTVSSAALDETAICYDIPILGTICSIVDIIRDVANKGYTKIGILTTPLTCQTKAIERALLNAGLRVKPYIMPCPKFASFAEDLRISHEEVICEAEKYMDHFLQEKFQVLIYGCTHYPLLDHIVNSIVPKNTLIIDPAHYIASKAKNDISSLGLLNNLSIDGSVDYICTGDCTDFRQKIYHFTQDGHLCKIEKAVLC